MSLNIHSIKLGVDHCHQPIDFHGRFSIGRPARPAYTTLVAQIATDSQIMDGLEC